MTSDMFSTSGYDSTSINFSNRKSYFNQLPESFSDLSGLFSVYLNNNILSSIGDSIGNLSNLYFLDLGYNHLQSLPESICSLSNLDYLWLFNNELNDLPEWFCDMELDWNNNDNGGFPFFAIGANYLCDSIATCVAESDNFELSLDQFYYSFPVLSPHCLLYTSPSPRDS